MLISRHATNLRFTKQTSDEESDIVHQAFRTSALQMKKLALTVHTLSTLYANVITDIINPGFSLVVEYSHHVNGESAVVVAQKQNGLQQYMESAEQRCRESAQEV
jgi:hypothetical protein